MPMKSGSAMGVNITACHVFPLANNTGFKESQQTAIKRKKFRKIAKVSLMLFEAKKLCS